MDLLIMRDGNISRDLFSRP